MKPISAADEMHADFAGDESTSVMGVDLLSSLTERSRRIEVASTAIPEPEISITIEEPEPPTTMRPATPPLPPPPAAAESQPRRVMADGEYPVLDDEESTMMMEEPEPTTVAVRPHVPLPAPEPAPIQPLPAAAPPEPPWTASLAPRPLETLRVAPLPAPAMEAIAGREAAPFAGSRPSSKLAAAALGVAALILGLGHHEPLPASAISSPAAAVTSAVVEPWDVQTRARATMEIARASLAALDLAVLGRAGHP